MVLTAILVAACTPADLAPIDQALKRSETNAATQMTGAVAIANLAVLHLAAALAEAATEDLGDGDVPVLLSSQDKAERMRYDVDRVAQSGRVWQERSGSTKVDMRFQFTREAANAGTAYTITMMSGHFEGYKLFFPRFSMLVSAFLGPNFQPRRHANGDFKVNLHVDAVGSFAIADAEVLRLNKAQLDLTYPLGDDDGPIGTLEATSDRAWSFQGQTVIEQKALRLRGAIHDPTGVTTHTLGSGPNGEVTLEAAIR